MMTDVMGSIIGIINTAVAVADKLDKRDSCSAPQVVEKPIIVQQPAPPVPAVVHHPSQPQQPININLTINFYGKKGDKEPFLTIDSDSADIG